MIFLRLATLSGLSIAWYGYHISSTSVFGSGLALVSIGLVLGWAVMPRPRRVPDAPSALVPAPEPPPPPPPLRELDILILAMTAQLKAARERRKAQ